MWSTVVYWVRSNVPHARALVILENDRGYGLHAVTDERAQPVPIELLPEWRSIDDLVYRHGHNLVDQDDYEWDDELDKVWDLQLDELPLTD
ncbi:hypothetical protein ASE16_02445 [Leifsonia sp. Root227]|nr:hypothetical protein ASE16_02445 [Leifsonia sp. Root227]